MMEERITALCQNFIDNQNVIKKVFRMESSLIYPIAANVFTAKGVTADEAKLRECKKIISEKSGVFSYLGGTSSTLLAAYLSMKPDPAASFERVKRYYDITKKQFGRSDYSALLAVLLSDMVIEEKLEGVLARGKEIYRLMREKHPLLTGGEDSVLAGFLAFSEKNDAALMEDMEQCYALLKPKFSSGDSVQTVSQILSMIEGSVREKTDHLIALYDLLKASGRKFNVYHLATLASVSVLDDNNEKLRDTMLEIDGFLSQQKGYAGLLGIDKQTRLMHAALLTTDLYDTASNAQTAASASTIAMVAAQQAAICILIASAAAYSAIGVD